MPRAWTAQEKRTVWKYWTEVWNSGKPTQQQGQEFGRICQRFEYRDWLSAMQHYYEHDPRPLSEQSFRPTPGMIAATLRSTVANTYRNDPVPDAVPFERFKDEKLGGRLPWKHND